MQRGIGIVTFPVSQSGVEPLSNLTNIMLGQSSNPLYIITGNEGSEISTIDTRIQLVNISHQPKQNLLRRMFSYAITQMRISSSMYQMTKNIDNWLFFLVANR